MSGCGCAGPCGCPERYTVLSGRDLGNTLAFQLRPVADKLRDLYTRFGMRPYEVAILRTRWSQGQRGLGQELVTWTQTILPTPLISDLTGIARVVNPTGLDEIGSVMLTQISGRYTEDNLLARGTDGSPPTSDEQVWWEVFFPRLDGLPGERRRFFASSAPVYMPDKFGWIVKLERSHQDRNRNGSVH